MSEHNADLLRRASVLMREDESSCFKGDAFLVAVADSLDQAAAVIEEANSGPLAMAMNAIAEPLAAVARTYLGEDS